MDDITLAQKIVGNTYSNILKSNFFHENSIIYKSSNERINMYDKYLKDKEKILSVISSSDQILNSILNGSKKIDAFDISCFPKYFLFLKISAVKKLTKEEYIKFFFDTISTDEIYDDLYFMIREDLDKDVRKFWDSLFDFYDWYDIYNSTLFSSEFHTKEEIINKNKYLKEENYLKLRQNLNKINLNLYTGNILEISKKLKENYDLIYLSNIINYVDISIYKEMLKNFNLNDNGIIITYLYYVSDKFKRFFCEKEFEFDKFYGLEEGVMIYKKTKKLY